jgi:hypothetical protein
MKKHLLLSALLLSFSGLIKAQIVVDAQDFSNNPGKFNGKTIVIKGVTAKVPVQSNTINPIQDVNLNNSNNNQGQNNANTMLRCTAPKSWNVMKVNLPNEYDGCFIVFNKMSNTLPQNKDVKLDITFKVDTKSMHRVTKIKVIQ